MLVLEDGRIFRGEAFGALGQGLGEAVFTTGMTGYQETLTDPSYHRQIVVQTAPQIGNTGWNDEDDESGAIQVAGYVVRDPSRSPSNWRSRRPLDEALRRQGSSASRASTPGRWSGTCASGARCAPGVFSGDALAPDADLVERVRQSPPMAGADLYGAVTTREPYVVPAVGRRGSGSPRSTSGSSPTPRGCSPRAASRPTCCPRRARSSRSRRSARTGSSCPTARATRPPPTGRSRSPGRSWSGGSRCSASASATRSSPGRWAAAPTSCATATAGSTSRSSSTPPGRVAITSQNHGFAVEGDGGGAVGHPVRRRRDHPHLPQRRLRRGPARAGRARLQRAVPPGGRGRAARRRDLFDRFAALMESAR